MPELELEPTPAAAPVPAKPSWLRRLFQPKDIGFYIMIVLAQIGAVYTNRWYWHWLIPIFGVICIVTQWNNVEPTLKARLTLVGRQILHWGAVFALFLIYMLSSDHDNIIDLINDQQGSFIITSIMALSTYLAGIYYDWRLCVVALFILVGGIINVAFTNLAPLLAFMGFGVVILYFAGIWMYNRWRERQTTQS